MSTQYQFEIAAGEAGNSLPASAYIIKADKGLSREVSYSLLTAKFGDGYEQRALDGINSKQETINISFNNRNYKEGNLIAGFFDKKRGLNFTLTVTNTKDAESSNPTETTESIKVTCESYNLVYVNDTTISIQTTLRRVYEPS